MKKTTKTIIATILALTLVFCSIPAFAYDVGETVYWEDRIHTYVDPYVYRGEMTEGTTYVAANAWDSCCKLNLEKEGFYLFSYDTDEITELDFSETVDNGVPCGRADVLSNTEEGKTVAYVSDAETYVGVNYVGGIEGAEITVSYYDSEIKDIEFEEGAFEELLFAQDFKLTDDENVVKMEINAEITFENGEKFTVERGDFDVEVDGSVGRGDYDATVSYHGYSEEVEMTIRLASDYIAKIEIDNIEDYLYVVEYPNGEWVSGFAEEKFEYEKVTVTFHDGTTDVIERHDIYDRYNLPNGRCYDMDYIIVKNKDGFDFVVRVGGQNLLVEKCEVRKASVFESLSYISEFINMHLDRICYMFKDTLNGIKTGNVSVFAIFTFFSSEFMRNELGYIFDGLADFVNYCS